MPVVFFFFFFLTPKGFLFFFLLDKGIVDRNFFVFARICRAVKNFLFDFKLLEFFFIPIFFNFTGS